MTACKTEIRSSSRWGSFSLAISRQIWRNRSTLYTNAVVPQPKTFSYHGEGEGNTAIRVWYCTRRCSPMRPGRDSDIRDVSNLHAILLSDFDKFRTARLLNWRQRSQ